MQRHDVAEQLVDLIRLLALHQPEALPPTAHEFQLPELLILHELLDTRSITQRDLAGRLIADKSTVSRHLTRLTERGWLQRTPDTDDGRVLRVGLTPGGRRAAVELRDLYAGQHQQVVDALTPAEREALAMGLAGLIRELRAARTPGAGPRTTTVAHHAS